MRLLLALLPAAALGGGSTPPGVSPEFDCAVRSLAYEFAGSISPGTSLDTVREALELSALCGAPPPGPADSERRPAAAPPSCDVHVNSAQSLKAGVAAARAHDSHTVCLAPGTYRLSEPLLLSAKDSSLRITAADPANPPTISGAVSLNGLTWTEDSSTPSLFSATLPAPLIEDLQGRVPGLHLGDTASSRLHLARYPNTANPFITDDAVDGDNRIKEGVATWLPPKQFPEDSFTYVRSSSPARADTFPDDPDGNVWYPDYVAGEGGSCEVYDPPVSYWCSNATQGGGAFQYKTPSGIELDESFLPNLGRWTREGSKNAVFNAWRPYRWENWMMTGEFAGEGDELGGTFTFTGGGHQGARGEESGGDWFVENV